MYDLHCTLTTNTKNGTNRRLNCQLLRLPIAASMPVNQLFFCFFLYDKHLYRDMEQVCVDALQD